MKITLMVAVNESLLYAWETIYRLFAIYVHMIALYVWFNGYIHMNALVT